VSNITKPICTVNPLSSCKRLRHWATCANRNWNAIYATELQEAQRICCSQVRRDIAVNAPYSNQFGIWPPGEEEHRDRVVNSNIGVEKDLRALHRGESMRLASC
jgi:hypothetical protein